VTPSLLVQTFTLELPSSFATLPAMAQAPAPFTERLELPQAAGGRTGVDHAADAGAAVKRAMPMGTTPSMVECKGQGHLLLVSRNMGNLPILDHVLPFPTDSLLPNHCEPNFNASSTLRLHAPCPGPTQDHIRVVSRQQSRISSCTTEVVAIDHVVN
jgi:hypothetical protein